MVDGEVVIHGKENAGTAVNAVCHVPAEFQEFRQRITQRHQQAGDQPIQGCAPLSGTNGGHRCSDAQAAADHHQRNDGARPWRQACRALAKFFGKMRAGDKIDDKQHQEFDEFTGDAGPDTLIARHP